jgi:hypothetical protein
MKIDQYTLLSLFFRIRPRQPPAAPYGSHQTSAARGMEFTTHVIWKNISCNPIRNSQHELGQNPTLLGFFSTAAHVQLKKFSLGKCV